MNVAVVDDNESWCFILEHFLRQHGFVVATYNDPYVFLEESKKFDLALIDFSIPTRRHQKDIDGPELIHAIKQRLRNPPLLILISAYFTDDVLENNPDIYPEADACLSKNIELEGILQQIKQLVATRDEHEANG